MPNNDTPSDAARLDELERRYEHDDGIPPYVHSEVSWLIALARKGLASDNILRLEQEMRSQLIARAERYEREMRKAMALLSDANRLSFMDDMQEAFDVLDAALNADTPAK